MFISLENGEYDITMIQATRLSLAGHLERMELNTATKKVYSSKEKATRRKDRQQTRYVDLVDTGAKKLGIPNQRVTYLRTFFRPCLAPTQL